MLPRQENVHWAEFRRRSQFVHTLRHHDRVISNDAIRYLEDEAAANGPLLPNLRRLEWTVWGTPQTASRLDTFLVPTLKEFLLTIVQDSDPTRATTSALQSLSRRSDIKLQRFEVVSYDSDLEDEVSECLHIQRDLIHMSIPSVKIGGKVDSCLINRPKVQSFYTVVKDGNAGDIRMDQWLATLTRRFPYLTGLGLSFDRQFPHTPNIPLREMASLIQAPSLLHVKLGFNPAIILEDTDVLAMGRAWPALQTLWIYNWGDATSTFPLSILRSFAMHMPPTLNRLSLYLTYDTIPAPQLGDGRFTSLAMLSVGHSTILSMDRPAVAAFLGRICPPGVVIRGPEDQTVASLDDREDLVELMELMRRHHAHFER